MDSKSERLLDLQQRDMCLQPIAQLFALFGCIWQIVNVNQRLNWAVNVSLRDSILKENLFLNKLRCELAWYLNQCNIDKGILCVVVNAVKQLGKVWKDEINYKVCYTASVDIPHFRCRWVWMGGLNVRDQCMALFRSSLSRILITPFVKIYILYVIINTIRKKNLFDFYLDRTYIWDLFGMSSSTNDGLKFKQTLSKWIFIIITVCVVVCVWIFLVVPTKVQETFLRRLFLQSHTFFVFRWNEAIRWKPVTCGCTWYPKPTCIRYNKWTNLCCFM